MELKKAGELELILELEKIFKIPRKDVVVHSGDDAAVVRPDTKKDLVITTDSFVENVHFSTAYMRYEEIGFRITAATVSDLAAMSSIPKWLLVSVGFRKDFKLEDVKSIYRGIKEAADRYGMIIIGGDTVCSPVNFMSVTAVGETKDKSVTSRSSAKPGDVILVTGYPGSSEAGRKLLKELGRNTVKKRYKALAEAHLRPEARIKEGLIALECKASAMEDISDGLLTELRNITEKSGYGAEIILEDLPLSSSLEEFQKLYKLKKHEPVLSGGEDFELVIILAEKYVSALAGRIKEETGNNITAIGRISERPGVRLYSKGKMIKVRLMGYEHFKQ